MKYLEIAILSPDNEIENSICFYGKYSNNEVMIIAQDFLSCEVERLDWKELTYHINW